MKPVAAAIHTKLGSATGAGSFHALLSGRYYHVEAPQNTAFPLAVWTLDAVDNDDQFGGSRILRGTLTFDIYCEGKAGAAAAMDIEEALYALLDQQALAVSGGTYGNVTLQCISRGLPSATDEFMVMSTTYSIFTTRVA
jgi:hypothetical protein